MFLTDVFHSIDFTRLKLVQGKKEEDTENVGDATNKMSKLDINQDKDITATFDAQDDEDVVF